MAKNACWPKGPVGQLARKVDKRAKGCLKCLKMCLIELEFCLKEEEGVILDHVLKILFSFSPDQFKNIIMVLHPPDILVSWQHCAAQMDQIFCQTAPTPA